ncbi:hypothetical protein [Idiomarina sp.]|uniref:hypothetical protein n=1 Tax=Idiomarina sp. TaxID=1874361 RepID=UPI0035150878
MLTDDQKARVLKEINSSLDKAEKHWRQGGYELVQEQKAQLESYNKAFDSAPSNIPEHPFVQDEETVIDQFIALVADMRNSSDHLMCEISYKSGAQVSGLERVFYETSALLPALALTIGFQGGGVTEYLGDGVLSLFKVDENGKKEAIYKSYRAANNVIGDSRDIVNQVLEERYGLPPIDIGVGLAMSKTIVKLVGVDGNKHPKAFGECVFRATKLSGGCNKIKIDERVWGEWPSSKGGRLKFKRLKHSKVQGYVIESKG